VGDDSRITRAPDDAGQFGNGGQVGLDDTNDLWLFCEVTLTNTTPSFRLREKHEQARPTAGHQLIMFLLRAMRDG